MVTILLDPASFRDLAQRFAIALDPDQDEFDAPCGHYRFIIDPIWSVERNPRRVEDDDLAWLRRCTRNNWALYERATERLKKARRALAEERKRPVGSALLMLIETLTPDPHCPPEGGFADAKRRILRLLR